MQQSIFGTNCNIISSTDDNSSFSSSSSVIVPLSADVTTTNNVSDKSVYPGVVSCISSEIIKKIHYVVADTGFNGQKLYDFSLKMGFELVCPVKKYKNTPVERLKLVDFYESALGQVIYSKIKTYIEPLFEHIKSVFRIDQIPIRGLDKVRGIVLLSVLLYQILVYYNCKTQKTSSKRAIKYLIGCLHFSKA